MCGIVGIVSKNKEQLSRIAAATRELSKRGPNHQHTTEFNNLAFGHARLSIIDVSEESHQPFTDNLNRYSLIFNGEIYNYKELKEELVKDGVVFKTKSDTEVLLYLYIKYKEGCLEKLNGFFAFSVLSFFPTLSESATASASQVLLVLACALFIRVINFIGIIGVLRSGGDINYSTFMDIFCMWCVGIPLTFIAVKYYNFTLVEAYIIALSEELIKVLMVLHRVHKKHWLKNVLPT